MTGTKRRGGYFIPVMLVIGMIVAVTNVFPFRQIIAQNRQVEETRAELGTLQAENEQLARETEALRTPSEVERIAREDFGYVQARRHELRDCRARWSSSRRRARTGARDRVGRLVGLGVGLSHRARSRI